MAICRKDSIESRDYHPCPERPLTGFDGRCDAIYLTTDANTQPATWDAAETAALRTRLRQQQPVPAHQYDFVVVGGGIAGMCCRICCPIRL